MFRRLLLRNRTDDLDAFASLESLGFRFLRQHQREPPATRGNPSRWKPQSPKSTKAIFLEPPTARKPQKPSSWKRVQTIPTCGHPWKQIKSLGFTVKLWQSNVLGKEGWYLSQSDFSRNVRHIYRQRLFGVGGWRPATPHRESMDC